MTRPTPTESEFGLEMLKSLQALLDQYEQPYELLPPPYENGDPGFRFGCGCGFEFEFEGEGLEAQHYTSCGNPACAIGREIATTARQQAASEGVTLRRRWLRAPGTPKRRVD